MHGLRLLFVVFGLCAALSTQAANPSLVVDVDSGRVLHAENATDPWYPASVTKLMTLYVSLKMVKQGQISLETPLIVSARATKAPPSRMGFKPGTEVTLDNALKMIMVKSANDVSTTIAEGLGGSVEGFASLMNQHAASLGMRESRFVNPHGLPDSRQQTSARDMAILGRALLLEFPEHQDFFQIGAIQMGQKIMPNHNGLIGRYPGADGMKTGFICASGFNVVASATRGGRRLITVVMGSPSAAQRTFKASDLFDQGFSSSASLGTLNDLPSSYASSPPDIRGEICGRNRAASEDDAQVALPQASSSGNSDNATMDLNISPLSVKQKRKLGPKVPSSIVMVWTGRSPSDNQNLVAKGPSPAKTIALTPVSRPVQAATKPLPNQALSFAPVEKNIKKKPQPILDTSPLFEDGRDSVDTSEPPIKAAGAIRASSGQKPKTPNLGGISEQSYRLRISNEAGKSGTVPPRRPNF